MAGVDAEQPYERRFCRLTPCELLHVAATARGEERVVQCVGDGAAKHEKSMLFDDNGLPRLTTYAHDALCTRELIITTTIINSIAAIMSAQDLGRLRMTATTKLICTSSARPGVGTFSVDESGTSLPARRCPDSLASWSPTTRTVFLSAAR